MNSVRRFRKPIALSLAFLQLIPALLPFNAYAITGGPSAPEVQQFSPAENTELVNLFTGDFNYQIPLLDVGGYPLTLSYSSNVGLESEASMVGLGWNINIGAVTRNVRGLPDDFNGDALQTTKYAKPDETVGFGAGLDVEIVGAEVGGEVGANLFMEHNNYDGWSASFGAGGGMSLKQGSESFKGKGKLGVSIESSSSKGAAYNADVSAEFDAKTSQSGERMNGGLNYGLGVNSRNGMKKQTFGADIGYKNTSLFGENTSLSLNNKIGVDDGKFKAGGKFNLGYGSSAFTPSIDWPMYKDGYTGKVKVGGEIGGSVTLNGEIEFVYENERYAKNYEATPAYGYMYAHNAPGRREVIDVLREKGKQFSKEMPNLPMAQFAHDLFQVNVQGIQSTFRPFRGDAGTLYDPEADSKSAAGSLGIEAGVGDLLKIGIDINIPLEFANSGKWREGNHFNDVLKFQKEQNGNPLYEPVYFKSMGEATAMANQPMFNATGSWDAIRPDVDFNGNTSNKIINTYGNQINYSPTDLHRKQREYRQNHFQWLNAGQASAFGFRAQIQNYPLNNFLTSNNRSVFESTVQKIDRSSGKRAKDHISEITVTRTDGTRFVFGTPAYNNTSTDVTFNISGNKKDDKGLVYYTPGEDNSPNNRRGKNNMYERETTPPHVYAWLLTDMLSNDYTDLTGNGPSPDDLGSYTRFNYSCANQNYQWRLPVQKDSALFKEGVKHDKEDDVAYYSYGAKELWYIHSIETKNYIAEFTYTDRDDAVGVLGENGGLDTRQRMKKLDKIELYTKASRLERNPAPLKTVHFVYDYSLCPNTPNNLNGGGKLTLKAVWFQHGSSEKGSRNPYLFSYSTSNPAYHPKKGDRWGCYFESDDEDAIKSYAALSKTKADELASSWLLTRIATPSGAILNITYESHDYAYVQDKQAMELFSVAGFTNKNNRLSVSTSAGNATLYNNDNSVNNYLQFKLKQPALSDEDIRNYVTGISELYFSMNVRLSNPERPLPGTTADYAFEKVEGFILVNPNRAGIDFGVCSDRNYGWLRLPQLHNGDEMTDRNTPDNDMTYQDGVHPVSKAAWETIRKKFMNLVYNEQPDASSPEALGTALENCFLVMGEMFSQANLYLRNGKHANAAKLKGARIRLHSPDKIKFGGGARVKQITVSDEWGNMVQDPELNFSYGKQYTYKTEETMDGRTRSISSGVASYEPQTGNEENPFVQPLRYAIDKPLSVDYNLYMTGPVGQIYFPSPVIGYSKVTIKDLQPAGAPATGFAVHEFYTARDFPTIVKNTDLKIQTRNIEVPPFYSEDHLNATQGFSIELNDMHGKPKSNMQYSPHTTAPVSGTMYKYKTDAHNNRLLDNVVKTIDPATGEIRDELVGVDYEFFADAREHQVHKMNPNAKINIDLSIRGPIVISIPSVYPGYTHFFGRLRMQTFNKVIYRYGLLEETVAFDNGAQVNTHNLLRDRESGEVILQDVKNAFGDYEYALQYPARWITANKGMSGAYKNTGLFFTDLTVNSGQATVTEASNFFQQGDELVCITRNGETPRAADGSAFGPTDVYNRAWVISTLNDNLYLIDRNGNKFPTGTYDILITRSGYRNHINTPAAKYHLLQTPIQGNALRIPSNHVLAANATEFSNHWQAYGLFESAPPRNQCRCNHVSINKRNAVDVLGNLVTTLLTSGNYKHTGITIGSAYGVGATFFLSRFGNTALTYHGSLSGNSVRAIVTPYNSSNREQQCELTIRMENSSLSFPDTVLSFVIDNRTFNDGDGDCNNIYTATGTITYLSPLNPAGTQTAGIFRQTLTAKVIIESCIPLAECSYVADGVGEVRCLTSGRATINPFVSGVLGNWRPLKTWVYATTLNHTGIMRTGGAYQAYRDFYTESYPLQVAARGTDTRWIEKSIATKIDPLGRNIESKDALGNYGAELYGYNHSLVIATATNARHNEIAYDGFEDYSYSNQVTNPFSRCPLPVHFKPNEFSALSKDTSHTGLHSLPVERGTFVTRTYAAQADRPLALTNRSTYQADASVVISPFSPTRGKKFFISTWVLKPTQSTSTTSSNTTNTLQQISQSVLPGRGLIPGIGGTGALPGITGSSGDFDLIVQSRNDAGVTSTIGRFKAEGNSIDGWQLVNGEFTVPNDAASVTIELRANRDKVWFDDLRIQPFNSVMKTFVYHPLSLRLMATMDENNYATYYVYDSNEQLIATKKETEDGILTVQEARYGTSKITRP